MVKRKKIWEHISFLQLFGMAYKSPVALNKDMRSVAFRYSTFIILSLTSYFIVSKWWPITEWNISFFSLVNFGSSWTAGTKLLLSGLDLTLFTALHTCNVSHHVTWIGQFSKWPSIKHQKKFLEHLTLFNISLICYLGFFNLRGM